MKTKQSSFLLGKEKMGDCSKAGEWIAELWREVNQSVEEIALALSLEADYVHTILYCAQGFSEDDPIAVARLVMMS